MVNWGIIGCGDVTEKKSGPAFNKVAGSSLIAVMRRNAEKAADYAHRHDVGQWYSDADELMKNKNINAIYIATPPASHKDYAITALKNGFNVYVEKPVTLNAAETREIAEAVKQYPNQKLTVGHYRRAVPMFLRIKELLDSGIIGDIKTAEIKMLQTYKPALVADVAENWRVQPEISGGGYFHDLAPHQLDLMLFYFGEPGEYNGWSANTAKLTLADDYVRGRITFKNKVIVSGTWCFNVGEEQEATDTCEIIGTKGSITFPFFGNYVTLKTSEGERTETFTHPEHIQQPMIEKMVAFFSDEGPNPCTIDEAVILMDIMDAFTKNRG